MTIGNGVAVQAAGGAGSADPRVIADAVLRSRPPVLEPPSAVE